jgi:hypothetical protein
MNLIYTSKKFIRTLILASFVILPTTVYADRSVNLAFGRLTTQSSTYNFLSNVSLILFYKKDAIAFKFVFNCLLILLDHYSF